MRHWKKRELLTYLDRVEPVLDKVDHFELLDVPANASKQTIQDAFHVMAAGLHPDRHRHSLDAGQYERLTIVYARIAEAYRVLRDDQARDRYLRSAARDQHSEKGSASSAKKGQDPEAGIALLNPKAQRLVRRAQAAQRTGDLASATLNLKMALAMHPQSGFLKEALKSLKKR